MLHLNVHHPKEDQAERLERVQANKTAIRYLVYWTLGIFISLVVSLFYQGITPENGIPLVIVLFVLLIAGVAYFRSTTWQERRDDAIRKFKGPTFE